MTKTAILAGKKEIKFEKINESNNGRIILARFNFRCRSYQFTNVYAPLNIEDQVTFFNSWSQQIDKEVINIVAEEFNVNLNPFENRVSQAKPHNDPSHTLANNKSTGTDGLSYEFYKLAKEK
ncbi:3155_t:CDS:2, partial [Gigaspora rosea]